MLSFYFFCHYYYLLFSLESNLSLTLELEIYDYVWDINIVCLQIVFKISLLWHQSSHLVFLDPLLLVFYSVLSLVIFYHKIFALLFMCNIGYKKHSSLSTPKLDGWVFCLKFDNQFLISYLTCTNALIVLCRKANNTLIIISTP